MTKRPLMLMPFAPASSRDTLRERLLELGYPVEVTDVNDAPRAEPCRLQPIAVCLFGRHSLTDRRESTLAVLMRWAALPRLGLFMGTQSDWDADVILRCNEFSSWPCPQCELDVRLLRLGAAVAKRPSAVRQRVNDLIHLNLIGECPAFLHALDRLRRFAPCDAPVLIEGETGTGKELAARAVHYLSERREHPFIPVNCGALPDSLLENELFGHAKGAFTDARDSYRGLIAQAEQGTLFLDEVESLTGRGQVALLRFLQEMEYRPLGSTRTLRADVRVIAATNVPIGELEARGLFRQDLLYRLNIMPVRLPALRERADDVRLLAEHFLSHLRRRYGQPNKFLHEDFLAWMGEHDWPGNIRELENLLHREFLLAEDDVIRIGRPRPPDTAAPVQVQVGTGVLERASFSEVKALVVEAFERHYLSTVMAETGGNVSRAARRAGKERRAFGRLLRKHGMGRDDYL